MVDGGTGVPEVNPLPATLSPDPDSERAIASEGAEEAAGAGAVVAGPAGADDADDVGGGGGVDPAIDRGPSCSGRTGDPVSSEGKGAAEVEVEEGAATGSVDEEAGPEAFDFLSGSTEPRPLSLF